MFIKLMLRNYFKELENFQKESFKLFSEKYIRSKELYDEIVLANTFKDKWHKCVHTQIENTKYKILNINTENSDNTIKCFVNLKHSFCIRNTIDTHVSEEIVKYIFVLTKDTGKWKITDIVNKEIFPSMYRAISENNNISYLNNLKQRLYFYEKRITKINEMSEAFTNLCKEYRTNYIETSYPKKYNYKKAIEYARKYALTSNDEYINYDNKGGDCTNFISQCLFAGGLPLSSTWKPYTNTWLRVNELYYYLIRKGLGVDNTKANIFDIGSIIQFYSNKKNYFSHSGIITSALSNGDYLYCCHSYNKKDYPLSEIFPIFYDKIRIVKIEY